MLIATYNRMIVATQTVERVPFQVSDPDVGKFVDVSKTMPDALRAVNDWNAQEAQYAMRIGIAPRFLFWL